MWKKNSVPCNEYKNNDKINYMKKFSRELSRTLVLTRVLTRVLTLLLIFCCATNTALAQSTTDLAPAEKAIRMRQFNKAFSLYLKAARTGDAEAQYQLANLYLLGRGVAKSENQGMHWLEKSAQRSHPAAQYALALKLVDTDSSRAMNLLTASSQQQFGPAITYLDHLGSTPEIRLKDKDSTLELWFGAARNNQITALGKLNANIQSVDLLDQNGRTALFSAIESDSISAAKWLLKQGADPDHRDKFGISPLFLAVKEDRSEILLVLLNKSADKHQTLPNGDNLLHYAIRLQHKKIIDLLIQNRIQRNAVNKDGWTPLDLAQYAGLDTTVSALKKSGAKHGGGWNSKTPENTFDKDQVFERIAATWSLPEYDTKVNFDDLSKIVISGNVPLSKYLLNQNATWLEQKLSDGSTLLALAVKNNNIDMTRTLLNLNSNPNARLHGEETALHVAAKTGNIDIAQTLLKAGADPMVLSKDSLDPVAVAIQNGNTKTAAMLITHLNNTQARAPYDQYLLLSAKHNREDLLKQLLSHTNSSASDELGRNALWFAAQNGNEGMIATLLKLGINSTQTDQFGKSPFYVAVEHNCLPCAQRLLPVSDINLRTSSGNSVLIAAAKADNPALVQWLLDQEADLEVRNNKGDTALITAVNADSEAVVKCLIEAGANASRKNKLGYSALDIAKNKNEVIYSLMKQKSVLGIF